MARITVEDCVTVVPNRFELCLVASNRAKSILSGAPTTLDRNEKPAVIALREIAEHLIDIDAVKKNITRTIRNRGLVEIVTANEEVVESIREEAESNIELKDNTFVGENLQVED
ncbi:MAG: DNA-directed RNA polymerase subunit omega [Proteobacteria bacterium]|nr:DNA-directed RNA polymerase subunit omega [Pseudomonadota bacterium]